MLSDADRREIDQLRERLRQAILRGDAEGYLSCLTEDAVILHPDSPQVRGKAALSEYLSGMFEAVSIEQLELSPVIAAARVAQRIGLRPNSLKYSARLARSSNG